MTYKVGDLVRVSSRCNGWPWYDGHLHIVTSIPDDLRDCVKLEPPLRDTGGHVHHLCHVSHLRPAAPEDLQPDEVAQLHLVMAGAL